MRKAMARFPFPWLLAFADSQSHLKPTQPNIYEQASLGPQDATRLHYLTVAYHLVIESFIALC